MHKVFISYHHGNDQYYKEEFLRLNRIHDIFQDVSVDTGDIDENLSDERIRQIIRDDYLSDSTVTIVLCGTETARRKHVDWEIYSSMFDGQVNKRSGILVINLPSINCNHWTAAHGADEKSVVYPDYTGGWTSFDNKAAYQERYPHMPNRILDNLVKPDVKISAVLWNRIANDPEKLRFLIDATFNDRIGCNYDLSERMRRANS